MKVNTILNMDALGGLKTLESESIDMCVTSPPYWGLRDYGTATWEGGNNGCDHDFPQGGRNPETSGKQLSNAGTAKHQYRDVCPKCGAKRIDDQLGLEATPEEYIDKMVRIFREVRRVLKKEGTCWVNMGDSYAASGGDRKRQNGNGPNSCVGKTADAAMPRAGRYDTKKAMVGTGIKPKDLCGIPWMLALALRQPWLKCNGCDKVDHQGKWGIWPNGRLICPGCLKSKGNTVHEKGWYLRQDIIWFKKNPMPESVTDRCTKSHEYLFLLTKSAHYFYDADAIREESTDSTIQRLNQDVESQVGSDRVPFKSNGNMKAVGGSNRNKRSVWTINTQPFSSAHFATFPEKLVEPCVKAGTSEKGCCSECGKAWEMVVEKPKPPDWVYNKAKTSDDCNVKFITLDGSKKASGQKMQNWLDVNPSKTIGWQPGCKCFSETEVNANLESVLRKPCIVLDPFMGAGTTALVARKLGRNYIGIELSKDYIEISDKRLFKELGMFV